MTKIEARERGFTHKLSFYGMPLYGVKKNDNWLLTCTSPICNPLFKFALWAEGFVIGLVGGDPNQVAFIIEEEL